MSDYLSDRDKWDVLVKVTNARYDITKHMLRSDIDKQDAIIWADLQLTEKDITIAELKETVEVLRPPASKYNFYRVKCDQLELINENLISALKGLIGAHLSPPVREALEKVAEAARKVNNEIYAANKESGTIALEELYDSLAALNAPKEGE